MSEEATPEAPDLAFRPAHYNDFPDPISAVLSGVHGSLRRDMIRDVLSAHGADADRLRAMLGDLHPALMEPKAHPAFIDWMTRLDARWIGGENLPEEEPGEVEIARITLDSSLREVTAIRARKDVEAGVYRYRVVDDHSEREYAPEPAASEEPFSLRELLGFLDATTVVESGRTLSEEIREQWSYALRRNPSPAEAASYVAVTSELYPELSRVLERRWEGWLAVQPEDSPGS